MSSSPSKPAGSSDEPAAKSPGFVSYFGKDATKDDVPPLDFFPADATRRKSTSTSSSPVPKTPSYNTGTETGSPRPGSSRGATDAISTTPSADSFNFTVPGASEIYVTESVLETSPEDAFKRDFAKLPIDDASKTIITEFLQRERPSEANVLLPVGDNKGCEECRSRDAKYHKLKSLYENFLRANPQAQAIAKESAADDYEELRDQYESLLVKYNDIADDCEEVNPIFGKLTADLAKAQETIENMAADKSHEVMEQLKHDNAKLADQLKAADDNYKYLENQARTVQRELDDERTKLADEEARYKTTRDDLIAKQEEFEHEANELRELEKRTEATQTHMIQVEADLKRSVREGARLNDALERREKEISDHNVNNKGILAQLTEASSRIRALEGEVKILNATVQNYEKADEALAAEKAINETLQAQVDKMQADTASRFNLNPMAFQPADLPAIKELGNTIVSSLADELDPNSPLISRTPTETESSVSERSSQAGDAEPPEPSPRSRELQKTLVIAEDKDENEDKTVTFVPTPLNETFEAENAPADAPQPEASTVDSGSSPALPLTRIVYVSKPTEGFFNCSPYACFKFVNLEFPYLLWTLALEAWKAITPLLRTILGIEFPSQPPILELPIRSVDITSDGSSTITPRSYRNRRPPIRMMIRKPKSTSVAASYIGRVPTRFSENPASRTSERRQSFSSGSGIDSDTNGPETGKPAAQRPEQVPGSLDLPNIPRRASNDGSIDNDNDSISASFMSGGTESGSLPAASRGLYADGTDEVDLRYTSRAIRARWRATVFNFAVELAFFYWVYRCYGVYSERRTWLAANDATRSLLARYIDLYSNRCSERCRSLSWTAGLLSPRWARSLNIGLLNVAEVFRYRIRSFKMAG